MLTNRTLARINNRPRKIGRVPLLIVGSGTVVLAALLYVFGGLPSLAILAFLGGGILQKDNIEIPVVLYGLLQISTPSGPKVRLEVSNRRAAARFARAFGAEVPTDEPKEKKAGDGEEYRRADKDSGRSPSKEGGEERRSAETLEKEARLATARRALGASKGAGAEDISAAYRKLARTHHPDKVANLEPEVREYSEQRMKEINAAYAEFKRQWNGPTTEGARVG
jgi:DnaJ domain